ALERGRAMLLREALDLHYADLDGLRQAGRAALAARYESAARRWRALMLGAREPDTSPSATAADYIVRHQDVEDAQADLTAAISEIRAAGFPRFVAAPDISDIRQAARSAPLGPIVP